MPTYRILFSRIERRSVRVDQSGELVVDAPDRDAALRIAEGLASGELGNVDDYVPDWEDDAEEIVGDVISTDVWTVDPADDAVTTPVPASEFLPDMPDA